MPKNRLDLIYADAAEVYKNVDFSWLEGKTVLVTGATGLLGTHFLACLSHLNMRGVKTKTFAVCHSDPADYTKEIANWGNINLVDDWRGQADAILHCAGYAQPLKFTNNQAETIRINTALTQRLLEQLNPSGKFLFVSSSEVYSGADHIYVDEKDAGSTSSVYHPRACYIEGKRCGEAIVNAHRQVGVDAKSARLCLAYGPGTRQNDQRAMSGFIRQALTEGRIDLKYPGREFRTFAYIRDAIEMMWNVLLRGTQPVYNIGGPLIYSVAEVASRIAELTYTTANIPAAVVEMDGSDAIRMSTDRYVKEFGLNEFVSLEDGLKRTIEWQRGLYEVV